MNCLNNLLVAIRARVKAETRAKTGTEPGVGLQDRANPKEGEVLPRGRF